MFHTYGDIMTTKTRKTKPKTTFGTGPSNQQKKHLMESYEQRIKDLHTSGGLPNFNAEPQWLANEIADDPDCKFIFTIWGSVYMPSTNKPVDVYMAHDGEQMQPCYYFVGGNTGCDIRPMEYSDGDLYQTINETVKLFDSIFRSYYTKPDFK